jgi:hypothetical protein
MVTTDAAVTELPAQMDRLELADASIVQCSWCDGLSFTNPCSSCAARIAGRQSAS